MNAPLAELYRIARRPMIVATVAATCAALFDECHTRLTCD